MEQAVAKLGAEAVDSILAAAMADPDAMRQFANDISPPAEPVQDYLTEVDTRRASSTSFERFVSIMRHGSMRRYLPYLWLRLSQKFARFSIPCVANLCPMMPMTSQAILWSLEP
ncbi:hypothetical protein MFIFM68171_03067 [Madurella fahalii]|uniref:Uncharacterized protein n=1 Tax=Madurella fahalii TaxID=1157608 RepID=A0ABQ0G532_9PEZI